MDSNIPTSVDGTGHGPAGGASALPDDRLFRAHFDNLPGPAYFYCRAGSDFVLIAHNRAAAAVKYSRVEGLHGLRISELQTRGGHDLRADLELSTSRSIVVKREIDHRYISTGVIRRLAVTIVPLSIDFVVVHTDDVTERRQTEDALRESEQTYRTIVDMSHEGIWAVDLHSVTTYVNRRAAEMLGYEPAELIGRPVFDFMDESLHAEARRIRDRRHRGVKEQFDFRLRHKNGGDVWTHVAASPITNGQGHVIGALHMMADITARKRAEEALTASEARNRALLDANPDMVLRVTRSGHYLDLHSADGRADRYLSRPASEVIGRHVSDVFDAEFARRQEEHCLHALATGDIQRWEYARMIDGEEAYFEARFVKSGDDEVVITVRDITQRVALEREVIATTERERTRIGHDLHDGIAQVLTGAKWSLEALRDKLAAADSKCSSDAERAVDLVRTAIEQTRNLAEGLSPIRKGGKLAEALEHLAKQSTRLLGVECRVGRTRISDDLSDTAATHLYRIAQEAITNAVKHGKSSRIDISCDRVQQRLVLSIVDNGIGAVEAARSGGMGMHIMSYRARSLGGELTVSRRRSGGMTVKCTCPWPGAQHAAMQKAAGE